VAGFARELVLAERGLLAQRYPGVRLLRSSADEADRQALIAAQFALRHVCWLIAYPVAGQAGVRLGMRSAFLMLAVVAAAGLVFGLWRWPKVDPETLGHLHPELPADHPHPVEHGSEPHRHAYVIDDLHGTWPGKP